MKFFETVPDSYLNAFASTIPSTVTRYILAPITYGLSVTSESNKILNGDSKV
jgi:hypothetical protein